MVSISDIRGRSPETGLPGEQETAFQVEGIDELSRHGRVTPVGDEIALRRHQQGAAVVPYPEVAFDLDRRPLRLLAAARPAPAPAGLAVVVALVLLFFFAHVLPHGAHWSDDPRSDEKMALGHTRVFVLFGRTG